MTQRITTCWHSNGPKKCPRGTLSPRVGLPTRILRALPGTTFTISQQIAFRFPALPAGVGPRMACTRLITLTRATRSQNWSHFTRWRRASWTRCAVFWPSLHLHLHHHHPRHFHHDHGHHHHHHDHYHQVEWLDELAKGINIIRYYCTLVLGPGSKEGRVRRGGFIAKSDNHLHNSLALFWPFRFRTIHQEITWVSSADHPAAIYPADAEAPWCGICAFQASTSIISPFPPPVPP